MPARRPGRSLAGLVGLLLLALAACGGGGSSSSGGSLGGSVGSSSPSSSPSSASAGALTRGTCWSAAQLPEALGSRRFAAWVRTYAHGDASLAQAMRDDAAFTEPTDCAKPHSLELYDVVSLPPALTARITSYAALLDQGSALWRQVRDQVNDRCLASSVYGRAERTSGGLPVQLGPALSATSGLHVAWDPFPADLWARGQHRFVCTFQQDRPGTLRFARLAGRTVPVTARVCLDTPHRTRSCDGPHQAEEIGEMVLNTAIERGRVPGAEAVRSGPHGRYVALSDAAYASLDRVCQTLLRSVSSGSRGVTARAYPGSADQWPTARGAYVASCFVMRPGTPPPAYSGSVFDRG